MGNQETYTDYEPKMEFSDRVIEFGIIEAAVNNTNPDKPDILHFRGGGGHGKSRLCNKVYAHLINQQDVYPGRYIFENVIFELDEIYLSLRLDLGNNSPISFLGFDIGWVAYQQAVRPDIPIQDHANWFGRNEDVIKDLLDWSSAIPGLGLFISRARKFVRENYARYTRASIKRLFARQDYDLNPGWILELLPELLADDINYFLENNEDKRIILLFDEYERLRAKRLPGEEEGRIEKSLKEFKHLVPNVQWIFFSREPCNWTGSDWQVDQQTLLGLPVEDADYLLSKEPIESRQIREAIIANSIDPHTQRVHPARLWYHIKHYFHLVLNEKRTPLPNDFRMNTENYGDALRELNNRLMRDKGQDIMEIFQLLTVPRRFNFEIFQLLFSDSLLKQKLAFKRITKLSEVEHLPEEDYWRIDHFIRETTLEFLDKDIHKIANQKLFDYFDTKAQPESHREVTLEHRKAFSEALYHLSEYAPDEVRTWWLERSEPFYQARDYNTIIPNLERVIEITDNLGKISKTAHIRLQLALAWVLSRQSLERESEMKYQQLRETLEATTDSEEQCLLASVLCGLGEIYIERNELEAADSLLRKANEVIFGEENLQFPHVDSLVNLIEPRSDLEVTDSLKWTTAATVCLAQARLAIARERFAEADKFLREYQRFTMQDNPPWSLAANVVKHELGKNLENLGRLSEAETLVTESLIFCREFFGNDHRDTWVATISLAQILHAQGRFKAALKVVKSAKEIVSFADHRWLSTGKQSEAKILRDLHQFDEAERLQRETIAEMEGAYGKTHPYVTIAYKNLAVLLTQTGHFEEAEHLFRRAITVLEGKSTKQQMHIGRIQNKYAELMFEMNRDEEGAALLERAREKLEAVYGLDHFRVGNCLNNFVKLAERLGDVAEANRFRGRIQEINRASSFGIRLRQRAWQIVPDDVRTDLLKRICIAPIELDDLGPVTIEQTDLSDIYGEEVNLIRYIFDDLPLIVQKFALKYRDEYTILDHTSGPIRKMNSDLSLKLEREQVPNYLWLFCEILISQSGHKFLLCEKPDDIDWRHDVDAEQKSRVEEALVSLSAEQANDDEGEQSSDGEWFLVKTSLIYTDCLFHSDFRVSSKGDVAMLTDQRVQENLAVATFMRGPGPE